MNKHEKQTNLPPYPEDFLFGFSALHAAGSPLDLEDFAILMDARNSGIFDPEAFARIIVTVGGADELAQLDRAGLDRILDLMVAEGFRHPAVPMLSAGQIALVETMCQAFGIGPATFAAAMQARGAAETPFELDGLGFRHAMNWLSGFGPVPDFAGDGFMDRTAMAFLNAKLFWSPIAGFNPGWLLENLGGGVARARDLSERQFMRIVTWLGRKHFTSPEPAPRVADGPGFITQPQANLIWKLWHELGGENGDGQDYSEAALDRALAADLGLAGGLPTLTSRGARLILDRQLAAVAELEVDRVRLAQTCLN